MRMTWACWDDDVGLLASTPPSTFTSNLHLCSLVLPCSCLLDRERKVRNGRVSWVGSYFS
jgi:hypothetical protein